VRRDRELERASEECREKLAKHRWRWTLDTSNANRVTLRQYAREVGRDEKAIRMMAKGYDNWRTAGADDVVRTSGPVTLEDFIAAERVGAERVEATKAVADATGKTFSAATSPTMRREVKATLATAEDRAERRGTTVSEELPRVAEWRQKAKAAGRRERDERNKSDFRLVEFEGHVGAAIRRLRKALVMAKEIDFQPEEVEILEHSLATLRTLVGLIDTRIGGVPNGVDWDAEFTKVMEES